MRPIDADALAKTFENMGLKKYGLIEKIYPDSIFAVIEKAPTIEAEPVRRGKWINKKRWSMGKWHKWLECSECKYQDYNLEIYDAIPFTGSSNYCPNCGAKMDGDAK